MIEQHPIKISAKIETEDGDLYRARLVISTDWLGIAERSAELPELFPSRETAITAVVDVLAKALVS